MKRVLILITCFVAVVSFIQAQKIIENPVTPISTEAGRVVLLEEVMRIKDDGKNIIFKLPKKMSLCEDGSILFLDLLDSSNLYKFSKDGKFIFKILKGGQGPRECQWANNYLIQGDRIRVQAWNPPKVIDYNLNGLYIEEAKTRNTHGLWFLISIDGTIYGIRDEIPESNAISREGLIETPYRLYKISNDFQKWKKLHDFPVQHYITKGRWIRRGMVAAAVHGHFLLMLHTAEYKIVKFDLQQGQVNRIFKRQYKRQKIGGEESEEDIGDRELKGLRPQPSKYYFDIFEIHIFRDAIWVLTSTPKLNSSKRLVDVFDLEGNYIDCFYLQFPENDMNHFYGDLLLSNDGYLFAIEQNHVDGLVSIGKYIINDNN
jgi:hypothetical protein